MSLVAAVRVPASTRTNKLQASSASTAWRKRALPAATDDVSREPKRQVKLLVDGHCETTLDVLWSLLSRCVLPKLAPADAVAREVEPRRAAKRAKSGVGLRQAALARLDASSAPNRLLAWVAAVCAIRGLRVHDLGVGLRDGLALCLLVRHYLPDVLPDATNALIDASALPINNAADRAVAGGLAALRHIDPHSALSGHQGCRGAAGPPPPPSPRWVACRPSPPPPTRGCGPDRTWRLCSSAASSAVSPRWASSRAPRSSSSSPGSTAPTAPTRGPTCAGRSRPMPSSAAGAPSPFAREGGTQGQARHPRRAARRMLRVRLSRLVAFVARAKARRANEAATLIQEAGSRWFSRRCGESTIVVQSTHAASYSGRLPSSRSPPSPPCGRPAAASSRAAACSRCAVRGTTPPRRSASGPSRPRRSRASPRPRPRRRR